MRISLIFCHELVLLCHIAKHDILQYLSTEYHFPLKHLFFFSKFYPTSKDTSTHLKLKHWYDAIQQLQHDRIFIIMDYILHFDEEVGSENWRITVLSFLQKKNIDVEYYWIEFAQGAQQLLWNQCFFSSSTATTSLQSTLYHKNFVTFFEKPKECHALIEYAKWNQLITNVNPIFYNHSALIIITDDSKWKELDLSKFDFLIQLVPLSNPQPIPMDTIIQVQYSMTIDMITLFATLQSSFFLDFDSCVLHMNHSSTFQICEKIGLLLSNGEDYRHNRPLYTRHIKNQSNSCQQITSLPLPHTGSVIVTSSKQMNLKSKREYEMKEIARRRKEMEIIKRNTTIAISSSSSTSPITVSLVMKKSQILDYCGLKNYKASEEYANQNHIHNIICSNENKIESNCKGSGEVEYKQQVWLENAKVKKSICTCPVGNNGTCKHIAALLISIQSNEKEEKSEETKPSNTNTKRKLPEWMTEEKKSKKSKKSETESTAEESNSKLLTPYFLFAETVRKRVMEENPDKKMTEIGSIIGQLWRELDEQEKQKYKDMYQQNKKSKNESDESLQVIAKQLDKKSKFNPMDEEQDEKVVKIPVSKKNEEDVSLATQEENLFAKLQKLKKRESNGNEELDKLFFSKEEKHCDSEHEDENPFFKPSKEKKTKIDSNEENPFFTSSKDFSKKKIEADDDAEEENPFFKSSKKVDINKKTESKSKTTINNSESDEENPFFTSSKKKSKQVEDASEKEHKKSEVKEKSQVHERKTKTNKRIIKTSDNDALDEIFFGKSSYKEERSSAELDEVFFGKSSMQEKTIVSSKITTTTTTTTTTTAPVKKKVSLAELLQAGGIQLKSESK